MIESKTVSFRNSVTSANHIHSRGDRGCAYINKFTRTSAEQVLRSQKQQIGITRAQTLHNRSQPLQTPYHQHTIMPFYPSIHPRSSYPTATSLLNLRPRLESTPRAPWILSTTTTFNSICNLASATVYSVSDILEHVTASMRICCFVDRIT